MYTAAAAKELNYLFCFVLCCIFINQCLLFVFLDIFLPSPDDLLVNLNESKEVNGLRNSLAIYGNKQRHPGV